MNRGNVTYMNLTKTNEMLFGKSRLFLLDKLSPPPEKVKPQQVK